MPVHFIALSVMKQLLSGLTRCRRSYAHLFHSRVTASLMCLIWSLCSPPRNSSKQNSLLAHLRHNIAARAETARSLSAHSTASSQRAHRRRYNAYRLCAFWRSHKRRITIAITPRHWCAWARDDEGGARQRAAYHLQLSCANNILSSSS